MKTSELKDLALDWAVAKCEGVTDEWRDTGPFMWGGKPCIRIGGHDVDYTPSTDWAQGGPLLEREKIAVAYEPSLIYDDTCRWKALAAMSDNEHQYGPTPLIAAMRCYVASKLGDDVEIPEELT